LAIAAPQLAAVRACRHGPETIDLREEMMIDRPKPDIGVLDDESAADAIHRKETRYPLSGITVIDLSHVYNGPYATFLMALAGAIVIKVEPFQGETLRSRGDMGGAEFSYAMLNSNKKPVTLNLKTERGRELLKEMVARADVVVENFTPGVLDRLGVGAAALRAVNPRLIYASSSGYGKDGPYRNYPAMDLVMQAWPPTFLSARRCENDTTVMSPGARTLRTSSLAIGENCLLM
jgi:hypothetical protein